MKASSILIIYTGGTIGMKQAPEDQTLRPFDFSQIAEEVPELRKFAVRIDSYTFDPLIDSSDVEPSLWVRLATLIQDRYDDYDGFVVLHGTDTMAYSASALSFMLEGLHKPVIFTGSQLPIGVPRTDGKENLISAVEIAAAKDGEGHPLVPEVTIYFDSLLIRGNRATKLSAEAFNAFSSPDFPPLAEAGIRIRYLKLTVLEVPFDQQICLSGIRIFGKGNGSAPEAPKGVKAERAGDLNMLVSWEEDGAVGHNILWGYAPEKLYHSYLITGKTEQRIGALVKGQPVYVRVDAFNENGITEGTVVKEAL